MSADATNSHVKAAIAVKSADGAELRDDIARLREQLGNTIEELAHRADVPARAKASISRAGDGLRDRGQRAADLARRQPGMAAAFGVGLLALVALIRRITRS